VNHKKLYLQCRRIVITNITSKIPRYIDIVVIIVFESAHLHCCYACGMSVAQSARLICWHDIRHGIKILRTLMSSCSDFGRDCARRMPPWLIVPGASGNYRSRPSKWKVTVFFARVSMQQHAQRKLAMQFSPSVRPSVRPDKSRQHWLETAPRSINLVSPPGRPITLVFSAATALQNFDGNILKGCH